MFKNYDRFPKIKLSLVFNPKPFSLFLLHFETYLTKHPDSYNVPKRISPVGNSGYYIFFVVPDINKLIGYTLILIDLVKIKKNFPLIGVCHG